MIVGWLIFGWGLGLVLTVAGIEAFEWIERGGLIRVWRRVRSK